MDVIEKRNPIINKIFIIRGEYCILVQISGTSIIGLKKLGPMLTNIKVVTRPERIKKIDLNRFSKHTVNTINEGKIQMKYCSFIVFDVT